MNILDNSVNKAQERKKLVGIAMDYYDKLLSITSVYNSNFIYNIEPTDWIPNTNLKFLTYTIWL